MVRVNLVRLEVPAVHGEGGGPGLQDLLTQDGALSPPLQPTSQPYSINPFLWAVKPSSTLFFLSASTISDEENINL